MRDSKGTRGKVASIILWLLGVPVSVLLFIFLCAVALNRTLAR